MQSRQKNLNKIPCSELLELVRACRFCEEHLPQGPRPVLQLNPKARLWIVGQAPGRRVHETGIAFNDPSGDRLRDWMGINKEVFYDETKVALVPMGFCFPGTGKSGDLPPRKECAIEWREPVLAQLECLELTLMIGKYALDYHLPESNTSVTNLVQSWRDYWPGIVPLPHPSPRNNIWLRRNPWFEEELIPQLQKRVAEVLDL